MNARIVSTLALALGLQLSAQAGDMQKICDYIKADDRSGLRATLDENDVDLRKEYADIKCGKYQLLRYAIVNGSGEAAALIISKGGKKVFIDKDADGMNAMDFAKKQFDSADPALKPKVKAIVDLIQSKS